jgi:mRNA interferase MazF
MSYERGDVVEAGDPFTDANTSRPFLVVSTDDHPFHGDQYVAVTLTTKTWYDDTIGLEDADFLAGGVPDRSSIVPWGVASPAQDDVTDWFGRIDEDVVDRTVDELIEYLRD